MATNAVSNVTSGKPRTGGAIYYAEVGTTLPTDAATDLDTKFVNIGYISEDGVSNANTFDSNDIKDWGGETVMSINNNFSDKFSFTMIETLNVDAMKVAYGDGAVTGTVDTGIKLSVKAEDKIEHAWVIEMVQRGGILKRIVIPSAKVTELGEITYTNDAATGYNVTLTAYPDANGATHYEYIKKSAS